MKVYDKVTAKQACLACQENQIVSLWCHMISDESQKYKKKCLFLRKQMKTVVKQVDNGG
jgi:hypothetical protein